ncbi:MAG: hypothetical protein A3G60_01320 [Candidatus Ryanbacteria bacterium RIFCSPLOWO2_12_FULL_47_9c]|uniref:Uncharacterized protein n=1 Tax=Candidatus Ryanbacteria bacterium RIFCSPLOWO2_12_FULL_47_9c TaxID=1802131 RepID=A0A1G2H2Y3_9BACT|nr:MAG: hypothetical protein A3G60_01320 [Candidatus Ryanbacteria bacterium RIFCSPLOWO2_12_FULL_47_9c]
MGNPNVVHFAKTNFRSSERTFGIRRDDRRQHMYIIGKTGTGKTNLLKNMAFQDINNGDGIAIVDPHGSFVEEVLEKIPDHRLDDVIYFNPADSEFPIGFNVLEVPDPKYKHLVASDLMGIFTKIWANVWSSRMEYILNNCVLALLDTPGTTLLGIQRILVDKDYRRKIIDNLKDPLVRSFWVQEYESWQERFRNEAIAPIQNKVGQFLSTSFVRNIVGQPKSAFNIQEVMNQKKILLMNVAKGRIGEDNAQLLGAMLITKIQLAAMERVRIPEEERKDFYLYVDEFQNFATDSFANILSEARKYRLNIIIAHQYIGQLVTETTTKVRDAVFGNCGTLVIFRVGAADAEFLENEFTPEFEIQDLVNLPNRQIYIKLMVNGVTSRPFSAAVLPAKGAEGVENTSDIIVKLSRKRYSRTRTEVEEEIERWSGSLGDEEGGVPVTQKVDKGERYTAPCSVCGKMAHVNFKPDTSRPIYCSECLKRVQAGEIPAVKVIPHASFGESLGVLGIEFSGESQGASRPERKEPRKPVPNIRKGSYAIRPSAPKPLSLKELRKAPTMRRGPDIEGLKSVLKKALEPTERRETSTLQPGDSVKL